MSIDEKPTYRWTCHKCGNFLEFDGKCVSCHPLNDCDNEKEKATDWIIQKNRFNMKKIKYV